RAGIALALAVVGVAWAVLALYAGHGGRTNLALNKQVTLSDSDPTFGVDPRALVNGDTEDLGFHTPMRPNTSVTIDLGTVQPISEVIVYNRTDCCEERLPPLILELSSDDKHYETVAQRNETFQRWDEHLPAPTKCRYVRLVHPRDDFFHLSEVEVYR
ncbi:MAG TPA: discoidin domain-containing protein, partial [Polyangiaceae bacterium]|nr:discoidin domain-containing protein [Polyangiaceae bacterium]